MARVYLIALGGNVERGRRGIADLLKEAISALDRGAGRITRVSRFFRSPAFPPGSGPDYINAALAMESDETPEQVLARLHEVEQAFGRERKKRWGARVLDLDLLGCGDEVRPSEAVWRQWRDLPLDRQMAEAPEELILPHPRLQDRAFVLVPLAEVAPEWLHPVMRKSVMQMCEDLSQDDRAALVPVEEAAG